MEPVTHLLTGACLARTGWNRRVAYATAAMAVAAEFPDIDTLWGLRGPVAGFEHHRGITHTFLGLPFEAAFLVICTYAIHRLRQRHAPEPNLAVQQASSRQDPAPLRWGMLYCLLLLALLSHILLDYTNNYGVRPFYPFDKRWYAGSLVFIFDPLLFLLLLLGLVLPALFGLIGREIGAKRERYRGRGWARAALFGVVLLWSLRWVEHGRALALAQNQTVRAPGLIDASDAASSSGSSEAGLAVAAQSLPEEQRAVLTAQRSLASPDPLSVFRWYTATDFGPVQQLGLVDTRTGTLVPGARLSSVPQTAVLLAAERSHLGRVYLDWSPMPVLSDGPSDPGSPESNYMGRGARMILFSDPRFMGDTPLLHSSDGLPPLTGEVVLDAKGKIIAEGMDGRFGR